MGAVTPFSYCINGFATGATAADAPTWGTGGGGPLTGTIGGPGGMNLDFQRVKVAKGGKSYIIQNNNWGNPNGSDQTLTYSDNSFKVTPSTGSGSQAPASFPSIFIGANGDVQAGTYSTRSDDHLPKQISAITSVMSTFRHTGTSGQLNATYDIWFSDHVPTGAATTTRFPASSCSGSTIRRTPADWQRGSDRDHRRQIVGSLGRSARRDRRHLRGHDVLGEPSGRVVRRHLDFGFVLGRSQAVLHGRRRSTASPRAGT